MDWKEKLGQANKLFEEAKAILTNPEATAEDRAKVEPMLADAQQLKVDALQLQEIMEAAQELEVASNKAKKEQALDQQSQVTEQKPFESLGEMLHAIKAWSVGVHKYSAAQRRNAHQVVMSRSLVFHYTQVRLFPVDTVSRLSVSDTSVPFRVTTRVPHPEVTVFLNHS